MTVKKPSKVGSKPVVLTKATVAELAKLIVKNLPSPQVSRLNVPRISFRRKKDGKKYENGLIVDTSALVDARVAEVVKTGFLSGTILVIPSVIKELHRLADSADDGKRMRGRRGLDCLGEIKKSKNVKLLILASEPKEESVDAKLVAAAKRLRARLLTVDFNLNKVAKVKGIVVLNINELANAIKTPVLPSDELLVQIKAKGKAQDQGVGYMADGTMVVVQKGSDFVGKTVRVSVQKVLQTEAGQMVFGKIA